VRRPGVVRPSDILWITRWVSLGTSLQRVEKEAICANQQLHKRKLKIERHHAVYMLQRVFDRCYGS
jgi:hypothetical protein